MIAGAITSDIDVTQLVFAAFVIFFLGLVYYLRQQDKLEGYPLEDPSGSRHPLVGFPLPPPSKEFVLLEGGTTRMPHVDAPSTLNSSRLYASPGAPEVPSGDPLLDAIGPAAYPMRKDVPLRSKHDEIALVPLREAAGWRVWPGETDPRGMTVIAADGAAVGVAVDLWVDQDVKILRYIEIEMQAGETTRRAMLPIYYADLKPSRRQIRVRALQREQFADIPALRTPNRISAREEDRVNAFFSGAFFYTYHQEPGIV
ncbi:MAG TPA: photosynthetic reaction center subunit H [Acetobacteraceae bacterium]|nr:photosynthetic reaction center subunit H [Acetobacteraceae bacterium]